MSNLSIKASQLLINWLKKAQIEEGRLFEGVDSLGFMIHGSWLHFWIRGCLYRGNERHARKEANVGGRAGGGGETPTQGRRNEA